MRTLRIVEGATRYTMWIDSINVQVPISQCEIRATRTPVGIIIDIHISPIFGQESVITAAVDSITGSASAREKIIWED